MGFTLRHFLHTALLFVAGSLVIGCGSNGDSMQEPANTSGAVTAPPPVAPQEPPPSQQTRKSQGDPSASECTTDADCVPASCCHASRCVAKGQGPSCQDVMCTQECRKGTIDCGGGCFCHEGTCAARLMPPLEMPAGNE